MSVLNYSVAIIAAFLWIGFVGAISFMESWLKFRAPGITVNLGLGIGRLVFSALNRIELILSLVIIINLVLEGNVFIYQNLFFLVPFLLLIGQTIWLLPALDARAISSINGQVLSKTYLHFYYIGMEIIKVGCLLIFGLKLLGA